MLAANVLPGSAWSDEPATALQSEDPAIVAALAKYKAKFPAGTELVCRGSIFSLYVVSTGANSLEFVIDVQPEYGPLTAFRVGPAGADKGALFALLSSAYQAHEPVLISFIPVDNDIANFTGVYLPPEHYQPPTSSNCKDLDRQLHK